MEILCVQLPSPWSKRSEKLKFSWIFKDRVFLWIWAPGNICKDTVVRLVQVFICKCVSCCCFPGKGSIIPERSLSRWLHSSQCNWHIRGLQESFFQPVKLFYVKTVEKSFFSVLQRCFPKVVVFGERLANSTDESGESLCVCCLHGGINVTISQESESAGASARRRSWTFFRIILIEFWI